MKFGIMFANTAWNASGAAAISYAQAAEAAGFESLWTVEHVVVPSGYESKYPYDKSGKMGGGAEDFDIPDPLIWMTWVAAATKTIRLGTGILILPQRNALITAKEVATLDALSGGRVELGVGVGWLAEEFAAIGVPFNDRGKRLDDHVHAMRALWTQDKATYSGSHVQFENCIMRPRPVQANIPIVVGGHTEIAARRAGRLGNGFFPGNGTIDELRHLIRVMRESAKEHGRDPDAIEVSAAAMAKPEDFAQRVEELAGLGVTRGMLGLLPPKHLEAMGAAIAPYAG
jgi:probable F420-dependent oxidoreductase